MIKISRAVALAALGDAVAEKGEDYSYPDHEKLNMVDELVPVCAYTTKRDGKVYPSCIAGNALARLGVPLAKLRAYDVQPMAESVSGVLADLQEAGLVEYTLAAENALQVAQNRQDTGLPWGKALTDATDYSASEEDEL